MSFRDDLITMVSRTRMIEPIPYLPPDLSRLPEHTVAGLYISRITLNNPTPGGEYDPRGELVWILTIYSPTRQMLESLTDEIPFRIVRRGDFSGQSGLQIKATYVEQILVEPADDRQSAWVAMLRFRSRVEFPY